VKEVFFEKRLKGKALPSEAKKKLGKQFNISYRVSAKRRKYRRIACRDFRIGTEDGCEKSRIQKHTFFYPALFLCFFILFSPEKTKNTLKENRK